MKIRADILNVAWQFFKKTIPKVLFHHQHPVHKISTSQHPQIYVNVQLFLPRQNVVDKFRGSDVILIIYLLIN